MSAKPNYFQIGLFILIAIAILVGGLVLFGAGQFLRPKTYMETYIDGSVQGVDVGTPVKFRGVSIGQVKNITFTFNEYGAPSQVDRYNYVVLQLEINKEMFPGMFKEDLTPILEKAVEQGLRLRLEPLGITGMNYCEINYLTDPNQFPQLAFNWTPHYYYIPSAPGQLTNILDSMNNIMRQVEQLNISGMSKAGTDLLQNLNKAITDAQIDKISGNLQRLLGDLQTALTDAKIGPLSDDARKLMTGLEKSNGDLQKVLKNLEPATRALSGPELKSLLDNLNDTTANLEKFSAYIKQKPSLLLWGTPPKPKATPTPKRKK